MTLRATGFPRSRYGFVGRLHVTIASDSDKNVSFEGSR